MQELPLNLVEQLERLAELHRSGAITDVEFTALKQAMIHPPEKAREGKSSVVCFDGEEPAVAATLDEAVAPEPSIEPTVPLVIRSTSYLERADRMDRKRRLRLADRWDYFWVFLIVFAVSFVVVARLGFLDPIFAKIHALTQSPSAKPLGKP